MKLLLTSNGLTSKRLGKEFVRLLEKRVQDSKILVIHTAQKPEHMIFVNEVGEEISKQGILLSNISYVNISGEIPNILLSKYDAVYVCGGNTYFILDRIRKTRLDNSLKRYVKSGGLYIGVSAGSIIAGQNIQIVGWGIEGDSNEISLKDLRGLGFTNIAVFPHYKHKLKREVEEFKSLVDYPVESLKDGEAIIIKDKKVKRIRKN